MVSRPRLSPQDTLSTFFFVNYSVITTLEDQISSIQNQPATHLPPCVALGLHFSAAYTFFIFSTWKITTLQWHIKYNQEAFQGTHTLVRLMVQDHGSQQKCIPHTSSHVDLRTTEVGKEIIKFTCQPTPTMARKCIPQCHIFPSAQSLSVWEVRAEWVSMLSSLLCLLLFLHQHQLDKGSISKEN